MLVRTLSSTWVAVAALMLVPVSSHGAPQRGARARAAQRPATRVPADASVVPTTVHPAVVFAPAPVPAKSARKSGSTRGWARDVMDPPYEDRRRRIPQTARPDDFGPTLIPGERFKFDVKYAGNPAGLAEAEVIAIQPDPRGGPPAGAPMLRLEGHARTSGIVSLLATVTDDLTTLIDARTGAAVSSENVLHYSGWAPSKYKHRVTTATYQGRGSVRIVDVKDGKTRKKLKRVPIDTFDPLSAMAWVRSLNLKEGERAKAHAIDGTTLLRVEIHSKGIKPVKGSPSIVTALELKPEQITKLEGTLTRVDRYDRAIPGKRVYKLRAWISNDHRRIPLVLESDMWVGAIRLELSAYDPPAAKAPWPGETSSPKAPTAAAPAPARKTAP